MPAGGPDPYPLARWLDHPACNTDLPAASGAASRSPVAIGRSGLLEQREFLLEVADQVPEAVARTARL